MCFIQVIIISLSYLFSLGSKSRHSNRTAQKSRFTYFNSKTAGSDLQLLLRYYYSHFCALVRTHFVNCFDKQFNFKVCMHKQVLVCSQKTFACSNQNEKHYYNELTNLAPFSSIVFEQVFVCWANFTFTRLWF